MPEFSYNCSVCNSTEDYWTTWGNKDNPPEKCLACGSTEATFERRVTRVNLADLQINQVVHGRDPNSPMLKRSVEYTDENGKTHHIKIKDHKNGGYSHKGLRDNIAAGKRKKK